MVLAIIPIDILIFEPICRIWCLKVKSDHRSKFCNISNWKEEAWKITGLKRDSNPWPPRYQWDARPTGVWRSHTLGSLGARSICWVHILPCSEMMWNIMKFIFCAAVVDESEEWSIYWDDYSSLSSTTAVQNMNFIYISQYDVPRRDSHQ